MKSARARGSRARVEAGLPPLALAGVVAGALLLLLAPPDSARAWGVNGFRSLAPATALAVVLAALASAVVARFGPRSPAVWWSIVVGIALLLAFPLREQTHLLGDTQLRLRSEQAAARGVLTSWFALAWERLHAQPLDIVVDVTIPIALQRLGLSIRDAVSTVSAALALAFFAAGWRLAGRLGAPPGVRVALALALTIGGALEGFAGYSEVAGLVAVAVMWWWAEMLAPLATPFQAWRTALAFTGLILSHRLGAVMLLPQMWRALGPAAPGDRPAARRTLAGLTLAAVALAAVAAVPAGAARQIALDVREILRSLTPWPTHLGDVANTLLLLAPAAPVALAAAPGSWRVWTREPWFGWIAAAALPLLAAQVWVFPAGESGLGAMRDWDSGILLGITLTTAAGVLLARLPEALLRSALTAALPLLTLGAFAWVAVNADAVGATRRAQSLLRTPGALTVPQRAHLHAYFGQRGMDERHPEQAAPEYEAAYDLGGNPRRALLAAEAYLMAGNAAGGRRMLARARAGAPLTPELEHSFAELEGLADRLAPVRADSTTHGH